VATLADIVRATGAKARSVQLWADAGVLLPDPDTDREGSGRHRQFSKREAMIACIIAPFAAEKVAIGGLKAIARGLRDDIRFSSGEARVLNEALAARGRNFVQITTFLDDESGKTGYAIRLINSDHTNMPLLQFLEEGASGSAKMNIIDLDHVLRPIREME
jgi:hypothetical protein